MKKTTITISVGLRNRIRHLKYTTCAKYEDCLNELLNRDRAFTNEQKQYTSISEMEELQKFLRGHEYCDHCGIVFEKFDGCCCPLCVQDESLSFDEQMLNHLVNQKNKLNRKISALKKATLEKQ